MKKIALTTSLLFMIVAFMVPAVGLAQEQETQKLAQTGFKFLAVSVDARAAAMGDAVTAPQVASSSAMFYNPVGMARIDGTFHVALGQTQWIADITYNAISAAFRTPLGVFGLSAMQVDYGDIEETIRFDNDAGFLKTGDIFSPTAMVVGLGYARALTDRFSVGGNVKYVQQSLGESMLSYVDDIRKEFALNTIAFDLGILYRTGFQSLNFGMAVRNFSRELTYAEENFELPLTFRIGLSMDLVDLTQMDNSMHSLLLSIDTERPRDFPEQIKVGAEYLFMNTFALRGGYIIPTDEQGITLGFGLQRTLMGSVGLGIDFTYTQFGVFDAVNRFSAKFSF